MSLNENQVHSLLGNPLEHNCSNQTKATKTRYKELKFNKKYLQLKLLITIKGISVRQPTRFRKVRTIMNELIEFRISFLQRQMYRRTELNIIPHKPRQRHTTPKIWSWKHVVFNFRWSVPFISVKFIILISFLLALLIYCLLKIWDKYFLFEKPTYFLEHII